MARTPTGSIRAKVQKRRKRIATEVSAREKRTAKTGGITKPTIHVGKTRTPEEFAKLSPAQQLYVKKGIVSSSEEGATRMIEEFKRKALAGQPAEAPITDPTAPTPQENLAMTDEAGRAFEGEVGMPAFDPIEKELALYGTATSQRIKQAITGVAVIGILGLGLSGAITGAVGGGTFRGAADPLAGKLGSIENLKLAKNAMGSKVLRAAAGQIPAKLIRKQITSVLARDIAINTVNAAKTMGWLTKIYNSRAARVGAIAVGGVMMLAKVTLDLLGTYPFAGFIPEESIQMLGMDSTEAITNAEWKIRKGETVTQEELDSIKRTLEFEREILAVAGDVTSTVPIKNVLDQLYKFYEGATIVNENKETRLQKLLEQVAGEEVVDW